MCPSLALITALMRLGKLKIRSCIVSIVIFPHSSCTALINSCLDLGKGLLFVPDGLNDSTNSQSG